MGVVVKVTRRGQTTIPAEYGEKLRIREGDDVLIEEAPQGLLVRPIPKLIDLAGAYAAYGTPEEAKRVIERMRAEY